MALLPAALAPPLPAAFGPPPDPAEPEPRATVGVNVALLLRSGAASAAQPVFVLPSYSNGNLHQSEPFTVQVSADARDIKLAWRFAIPFGGAQYFSAVKAIILKLSLPNASANVGIWLHSKSPAQ